MFVMVSVIVGMILMTIVPICFFLAVIIMFVVMVMMIIFFFIRFIFVFVLIHGLYLYSSFTFMPMNIIRLSGCFVFLVQQHQD